MKKTITLLAVITLLTVPIAFAKNNSSGMKSSGSSIYKSGSNNKNQYKYKQKNQGDGKKSQYKQKNKNGSTYENKKGQRKGNY